MKQEATWYVNCGHQPFRGEVRIQEQEVSGNYDFCSVPTVMTRSFENTFGMETVPVVASAISQIVEKYGKEADYLQVFKYIRRNGTVQEFWLIHDRDHVTALLPEDY